MGFNKVTAKPRQALPAEVKAALANAVAIAKSQTLVARELGVSGAVVSYLLADKYPGNVEQMADRIRGKYLGATVRCPVYGTLPRNNCLDYQALPAAYTNPLRAALARACKTCPNRKESK
jgi:hypothetical protein